MSKYDAVRQFQKDQGYNVNNLKNPGWGSHVKVPGQSFMDTRPHNSMYGNIWNQMGSFNQSPLYCNVNYAALGGYGNNGCNNIFGINYGMNDKAWNSYNNAMSSGYNLNTAQNKVGTGLTWINGIGAMADGITNAMGSIGNMFGNLGGFTSQTTEGSINGVTGVFDGVTNGVKNMGSFFSGLFGGKD